jgi:hypothetical protein
VVYPWSPGEGDHGLTDCERDCLRLLARTAEPLSGVRVRNQLESQGLGIYGLATVKRCLARLKKRGVLTNSKRRPRGYSLLEPPFVRAAG